MILQYRVSAIVMCCGLTEDDQVSVVYVYRTMNIVIIIGDMFTILAIM